MNPEYLKFRFHIFKYYLFIFWIHYVHKLNLFFYKKPTFYSLINILEKEELLVKDDYEDLIIKGFKKVVKLGGCDYYSCLIYFK